MVQAVSRAIRAAGCANCRTSLLRSFTSIAGVQWPATQIRPRRPAAATIQRTVRHSSSIPQNASKLVDDAAEAGEGVNGVESIQQRDVEAAENGEKSEVVDEEAILEEEALFNEEEALLNEEASTSAETESSTPWYLQVDTPAAAIPSLSERQKLPELPASSPAILEPLLNRISIDLGLDDLSLLDLRKLDPPPALGANLIMIVGTARSEKHLHVSADRLCRWLRTEYKLRPDADGLLGRNELKLKLKRKAKKAKLVGSVPHEDDADDGVRTGWVCVNVGTVESAELEATGLDKGFVGFGRKTEGTKIVVQMLVEEKRVELDLERLWSGIAKRQSSGLPLDVDIEEDVMETLATGEPEGQAPSLGTSPVIKVHDAYASPFPTTTSFSPMAVEDRGSRTKSEAS